jgi:hypothetical protein
LQESDQPRRAGRPSLLSEQPPPGDSHSILSKLDDRPAVHGRRRAPVRSRRGRAAGVVALLLVAGGSLFWMATGDDLEAQSTVTVAAPAPQPPSVTASVPVPVPASAPEAHASVAAILEDTPHLPGPAPAAAPAKGNKEDKDELLTLLDAPARPKTAAKQAGKPAREAVQVAQADKPARKDKTPAKEGAAARDKDKARAVAAKKPAAKAAAPVDTDVALLAALLAHTKKAPAPLSSKAARELKRCAALGSAAEVDKCRERLCTGDAKAAPECKPPRVAKASE